MEKNMNSIKAIFFSLNIVLNFLILYLETKLSFSSIIITLALMYIAAAVHLLAHECGHLIGGLASGYKFVYLQIGPMNLETDRFKKLSFSLQHTHGGQCIMLPIKTNPIRYKAYNIGGIYANVFITIVSTLLLFFDSFYTTLFFIQLLFIGIIKIIANSIPCINHDIPNDGYILKLLRNNTAVQKDYFLYLSLYTSIFWNEYICPSKYSYTREPVKSNDELLYYNGIQDLLKENKNFYM